MVKIDIISGFLGAGKTTLIRKLIQQGFQGEKVVLIENEFGEIGIDGGFLQEVGVEIREMNSGCICCSLVGDFEESLKEVITTYTPERIIIEPSGVGKLSDVIKAVESVTSQGEVELNNKITVVNAAKCNMYMKNFGEFFLNQVEHADSIVLSRTGGMTDGMLDEVVDQLRVHNHHGTMITTPWEQLDGADMLASMEHQHTLEESMRAELHHDHEHGEHCGCGGHEHDHHHEHGEHCGCGGHDHDHHHEHDEHCGCDHHEHHQEHHHEHGEHCGCGCEGHEHDHHHHHHADEVFASWGVETTKRYTVASMQERLERLENEHEFGVILRAKGMVACEDDTWIYFDYVPGEVEVREGKPATTGKLCVIGSQLKEEMLRQLFES